MQLAARREVGQPQITPCDGFIWQSRALEERVPVRRRWDRRCPDLAADSPSIVVNESMPQMRAADHVRLFLGQPICFVNQALLLWRCVSAPTVIVAFGAGLLIMSSAMPSSTAKRLGYLVGVHPVTSQTFVRTEILAHEAEGWPVVRYSVRPWNWKGATLVDPDDQAEARQTTVLLPGGLAGLLVPALLEALRNPLGVARGLVAALRLVRRGGEKRLYPFAYLLEAAKLRAHTRAAGVTHLHCHFSVNTAAVALLAHRMGGPEFSFTVHGPDELPGMRANGIEDKVRHARAVAAITDYCRGVILEATDGAGADKVHVVRCGLELGRFRPTPVPAASRTLVCVGRLCPQKAQTLLVDAAARLKDSHPDLRILLIGDGETRPEIEAMLEREGLQDRVVLNGWASGDEVRAAIAAARALILPSFAEGLPMVIMEAMALGRPVISTRIAGIPELLDDSCGWIVDAGDVDGLTSSIAACLEADVDRLHAMGAEGRTRVEQRHDQAKNARGLRRAIGFEPGGASSA